MGTDKAMLNYRNQPQAVYLTTILEDLNIETYISCRKGDSEKWKPFKTIEDRYIEIGPMAGILSAFERLPGSALLVLACDYPLLRTQDLTWLLESRSKSHDVTTINLRSHTPGEPLLAIWEPSSELGLRKAFDKGNFKLMDVLKMQNVHLLQPESPTYFTQANDPAEKKQIDEFLQHHST
jgi:molybdopterin-guanine dinucleotide biosynthesis protein A